MNKVRWLYHVLAANVTLADSYAPDAFVQEGYIHCSFRDEVVNSARLYFPAGAALRVLQIDPRLVGCELRVVETPRGKMPHLHGRIPRAAIVGQWTLDQLERGEPPDDISG